MCDARNSSNCGEESGSGQNNQWWKGMNLLPWWLEEIVEMIKVQFVDTAASKDFFKQCFSI